MPGNAVSARSTPWRATAPAVVPSSARALDYSTAAPGTANSSSHAISRITSPDAPMQRPTSGRTPSSSLSAAKPTARAGQLAIEAPPPTGNRALEAVSDQRADRATAGVKRKHSAADTAPARGKGTVAIRHEPREESSDSEITYTNMQHQQQRPPEPVAKRRKQAVSSEPETAARSSKKAKYVRVCAFIMYARDLRRSCLSPTVKGKYMSRTCFSD